MAITLKQQTDPGAGSTDPQTQSIAGPASLVNGLLVVSYTLRGAATNIVTSKWAGVDLAKAVGVTSQTTLRGEIWYLVNPAAGTNNLVTDFNTAVNNHPYAYFFEGALQDQANVLDQINDTTANDAAPTINITPTSDGQVIVDAMIHEQTAVATANNQTLGFKSDEGVYNVGTQYAIQTTAGLITLNWTEAGADIWTQVVASFKPAAAGAATVPPVHLPLLPQR